MKNRLNGVWLLIAILSLAIASSVFTTNNASALSEDELYKRALLNAMDSCYKETEMHSSVKANGSDSYSSFQTSILMKGKKQSNLYIPTSIGTGNALTDNSNGTKIGCYELFLGDPTGWGTYDGTMKGLFDLYGKTAPSSSSNSSDVVNFVKAWGYTDEVTDATGNVGMHCVRAKSQDLFSTGHDAIEVANWCVSQSDIDNGTIKDASGFEEAAAYTGSNGDISVYSSVFNAEAYASAKVYFNYEFKNHYGNKSHANCASNAFFLSGSNNGDGALTVAGLQSMAEKISSCSLGFDMNDLPYGFEEDNVYYPTFTGEYYTTTDTSGTFVKYRFPNYRNSSWPGAAKKGRAYFAGGDGAQVPFDDQAKYELYSLYLNKVYGVDMSNNPDCQAERPSDIVEQTTDGTKYYVHMTSGWCRVALSGGNVSKKVSAFTSDENKVLNTAVDFTGLLELMAELTIDESALVDPTTPSTEDDPDAEVESPPSCYDKAGSLGWIMCPIIEGVGGFIVAQYENWIMPALQIDVGLFKIDGDQNGTYRAWSVFRDIANIAFVLMFLFVIFSQLTGVGIDNYGVKKALPNLIMAALMINLSFFICQGAIDICNVVGYGIGGLFKSIKASVGAVTTLTIDGTTVTEAEMSQAVSGTAPGFAAGATTAVIIIIIAALMVATVLSEGFAILIPILLLFISVAISVVALIAILGIRQAAAVLLTVASPMAFVCYVLPNMKSVFDKWFKAFEGLLIAFPICSALVYGGDMAANILLVSSGGNSSTWIIISAAAISMAPIFFIPGVIRNSMGAISHGIAGFGKKMDGKAKTKVGGALDRSPLTSYRNYHRNMVGQRSSARQSEYDAKRGRRLIKKYDSLSKTGKANPGDMRPGDLRNYNAALAAVNKNDREIQESFESHYDGMRDDEIIEALVANVGSEKPNDNMIVAGLSKISDEDKLFDAYIALNEKGFGDLLSKDGNLRSRVADAYAGRNNSVINQSLGKLIRNGDSYESIMNGGLAKKVQGAGTGVMASQNKDVFNTAGAANLFSNEQLAAGIGAGYSGSTADSFNSMLQGIGANDSARMNSIVGSMNAAQVANFSTGSLAAVGGGEPTSEKALENGASIVAGANQSAIDTLNSADGANLRTTMNGEVMTKLGISSDAPAGDGGGAEATFNPAMMTDDDLAYANKLKAMSEGQVDVPHESKVSTSHFQTNPRIKEESAEYIAWKKQVSKLAAEHPLLPGEKTADWQKRVGTPPMPKLEK